MIRMAISVEGQTEDEFVKTLLVPFFRNVGIALTSIIVTTSKEKCGIKHKGGCINLDRVKSEISKLLPNFDYVTTFYDLYRFDIKEKVDADTLENKIHQLFKDNKNSYTLIPDIQQYEFETLLFSFPEYYADYFGDKNAQIEIENIIQSCGGIEKINNSTETSPSKRIESFFNKYGEEQYDKVFHGASIASDITLEMIVKKCFRFNRWLEKLNDKTK